MSTEAITSEIKLNGIETTCGVAEIKHLSKYYLYYREQAPIQGSIPTLELRCEKDENIQKEEVGMDP